jgi:hypothetical protein
LNTLGVNAGASLPDVSALIRWVCGPVGYAKFLIPISLWFLGVAGYFCFRRFGMSAMTSILAGLAACLTTGYFSNACWGAAPPIIAFGMDFLALGALAKKDKFPFWIAPALGGMAVGINVMEAADVGALFSMMVAAFAVYQAMIEEGAPMMTRVVRGVSRTIIVAAFAGFIAAYAVSVLVGANIKGIVGVKQDEQSKAAHWDFATSWSMPKRETLALIVPNLFGCSVVTPGAANYWGGLGTDPAWDRYFASDKSGPPPSSEHFIRHTGRGIYLGVLVVFIGIWAALQSFRKKDSVFSMTERKLIWFWLVVAVISLLFAYGRFAPFYRLIYNLPYFSTIRNPDKFLHFVTFASVFLFAYGLHGLHRRYLQGQLAGASGGRSKSWWSRADVFERRWVVGSVVAILLSLVGWLIYFNLRGHVEDYLAELQRLDALRNGRSADPGAVHDFVAGQVAFSLRQVGWFVLGLCLSSAAVLLIFRGTFTAKRVQWAGVLLGIILVGDLARANWPYITFWNYKEKYEAYGPNPIIKFLADKSYEHRVAVLPFRPPEQLADFDNLYRIEWAQQLFPFYGIQTLDIVQMPRMPQDLEAFERSMQFPGCPQLTRRWELTDNRYLLGPAGYLDALNQQLDPTLHRFRIVTNFDIVPKPFVTIPANVPMDQIKRYARMLPMNYQTAGLSANGDYALFEFTGALPRVNLYSNWQTNSAAALAAFTTNGLDPNALAVFDMVGTNDFMTLQQLASASFKPEKTVLLPKAIAGVVPSTATNQEAGTVTFTSYVPADIKLDANATSPSILMLSDKYDPDWQVWVDGKRAELLRCDYLLRGVYLAPGHHEVKFLFRADIHMLYVNVAAIFVGACLLGYAVVATRKSDEDEDEKKENSK